MENRISKTQIDRLGDRLRIGNITDADLRLLDEYRRSFTEAYDVVAGTIRRELQLEPTGRPAKSTTSIAEKLRRESIRLTQIQDIAGCRLIVPEIANQEHVVASLVELLTATAVIDRRQKPSHGYRAVHIVATIDGKAVEIQVRTALQQVWAELSEKLSDLIDPAIKYGGGEEDIKELLSELSVTIAEQETNESRVLQMQRNVDAMLSTPGLTEGLRADIIDHQGQLASFKADLGTRRQNVLDILERFNRRFEDK